MYSPWDAQHDDFFDEGDGYSGAEEEDDEAAAPPPPSGRDARAEKDPSRVEELERENLRPADAQAREPRGEVGAAERPRDSVLGVDASSVTRVRRSSEPGGEVGAADRPRNSLLGVDASRLTLSEPKDSRPTRVGRASERAMKLEALVARLRQACDSGNCAAKILRDIYSTRLDFNEIAMMGLGGLGGPLDMLRKTGSRDERRDAKRLINAWNRIVTDGRAADERFKLEATTRKASALEADEKKEERRDDAPSRRRAPPRKRRRRCDDDAHSLFPALFPPYPAAPATPAPLHFSAEGHPRVLVRVPLHGGRVVEATVTWPHGHSRTPTPDAFAATVGAQFDLAEDQTTAIARSIRDQLREHLLRAQLRAAAEPARRGGGDDDAYVGDEEAEWEPTRAEAGAIAELNVASAMQDAAEHSPTGSRPPVCLCPGVEDCGLIPCPFVFFP
ncbi:hypothetical protein JL722_7563 [Aureococcus anophagefferens]|nr:hypothetical protein JL722_7563 [Aureococcus anophagefferens]